MLRGSLSVIAEDRPVAISVTTGRSRVLDDNELRFLSKISAWDWIARDSVTERFHITAETVDVFLKLGLLIGDSDNPEVETLRKREERLSAIEWDEYAFYYHMMNRTKDVVSFQSTDPGSGPSMSLTAGGDVRTDYFEMMNQLSNQLVATAYHYGPAPTHFYEVPEAIERRNIPPPEHDGPLFQLLSRRKTFRLFDPQNPMTEAELSSVLHFTFGCHGYATLNEGVIVLRKTSPSGGALHPIEAYPIVMNVRGWQRGIYHYNVQHHRLDLLRKLDSPDAERLVEQFTAGQSYFATAHVLFILVARFDRHFWKYRRAPRSFRVIQIDAGHLSQTMSLVCTELGLGAFCTAAINDINIEDELGIDPIDRGVVGVLGCGRPVSSYALTLETVPYSSRNPFI